MGFAVGFIADKTLNPNPIKGSFVFMFIGVWGWQTMTRPKSDIGMKLLGFKGAYKVTQPPEKGRGAYSGSKKS